MQNIPYQQVFTLEYTPADFFYLTDASDMPQGSEGCINTMAGQSGICANNTGTLSGDQLKQCYQYELCLNKVLVEDMYSKRGKHSQASAKLNDFINKYHFETYKTWNLGIGLVIILFYIYYNKA
jgi:hypothetical protein